MEKTVLDEKLRNAKPDYIRVDKDPILSQLAKTRKKHRVSKRSATVTKSVVAAVSGVAVASVITMNIPLHHSSSNSQFTTGDGPSTTTNTSPPNLGTALSAGTISHTYSYLGLESSFQPMLPTAVPSGYQLSTSALQIHLKDNAATSYRYNGIYSSAQNNTKWAITEVPGNSIDAYAHTVGSVTLTVPWHQTVHVNNQIYYLHPASATDGWNANIVGFVRNHVAYELSSEKLSDSDLLKFAQSDFKAAPASSVKIVNRVATGSHAIKNISFNPISLPSSISSKWVLQGTASDVTKTSGQSSLQQIDFSYDRRGNTAGTLDVLEVPLSEASQVAKRGPWNLTKTWADPQHGIEIQVSGNITQSELNQIVTALKTSN